MCTGTGPSFIEQRLANEAWEVLTSLALFTNEDELCSSNEAISQCVQGLKVESFLSTFQVSRDY